MTTLHERFLDHLAASGWTVRRAAPGELAAAVDAAAGAPSHAAFLSLYTQLNSADDTRWFLAAADYTAASDDAFGPDAFRQISMDAAMSEADRQAVTAFWARHLPIFMSVGGDYAYLALDRDTGRIVHGVEPAFEEVSVVAESLDALLAAILAGGAAAALLD
ncbi:hypothetical protein CEG14_11155 [Bordetella genomosp. 1]|uniref:SMI1/KNR4 family protein n=1 Tax=Bordetella genomosp. 1 TaxID=1395607 RepID=A0A261SDY6_9BORD|nr:hypothetical protein [Bordetella genomosp. 1]OZI35619.1 hypothetical protein CEG14_11155 [Bordetella genomosp. 1]